MFGGFHDFNLVTVPFSEEAGPRVADESQIYPLYGGICDRNRDQRSQINRFQQL